MTGDHDTAVTILVRHLALDFAMRRADPARARERIRAIAGTVRVLRDLDNLGCPERGWHSTQHLAPPRVRQLMRARSADNPSPEELARRAENQRRLRETINDMVERGRRLSPARRA